MKKFVLAAALVFSACSLLFAQEGGMSEDEMMKKWMEIASPKAQHEQLAKGAGEWTFTMKFWMAPNTDPATSTGTSMAEMVNGGRVVSETVHGDAMGMPFEGHGMTGYDNFRKEYWSTWTDNMATSMTYMTGASDDGGKTVVFNAKMDEPMSGQKDMPMRFVHKWVNDDEQVLESWSGVGTEQEFKSMEITYTRKK